MGTKRDKAATAANSEGPRQTRRVLTPQPGFILSITFLYLSESR